MKRCSRPDWRHCYWKRRALWFDLGFVSKQRVLISLFKSKRPSQTCCVSAQTHTRTDRQTNGRTDTHLGKGRRESLSVVSDFQPIHKHKRPLCQASSESLGRVPVRQSATFPAILQLKPKEVLSAHRLHLTGSKLLKKRVESLLNWRRKTRHLPARVVSSALPSCESVDIFCHGGIQLPTETSSKIRGGKLSQAVKLRARITVNHWRKGNSPNYWQMLESFSQDISRRMSKVFVLNLVFTEWTNQHLFISVSEVHKLFMEDSLDLKILAAKHCISYLRCKNLKLEFFCLVGFSNT